MLGVVVHVPVEKLEQGVEVDRAAAEAKIWHLVLQPNVLCGVAKGLQPRSEHFGKCDDQRDNPVPISQRYTRDREVADEQGALPSGVGATPLWVAFGKEYSNPGIFSVDMAGKVSEFFFEQCVGVLVVYNGSLPQTFEIDFLREYDFLIVGRVQGVFVVLGMAGPEEMVVVPAEEG